MLSRTIIAVLLFGLASSHAFGQIASNPVAPVQQRTGITLLGDFGAGINDWSGKARMWGGRVAISVPLGGLWLGAGSCDSGESGSERMSTLGGGLALNVVNKNSLPTSVSLQVGAGTGAGDCQTGYSAINATAGAAFSFTASNSVMELTPWIMPRVQMYRFSFNDSELTQAGVGISGGIAITLTAGIGIHAAVDWASFGSKEEQGLVAPARRPLVIGLGAHYRLSVPGFGVSP